MSIPHWSPKSPEWSKASHNLLLQKEAKQISVECIEDFIEKSNNFTVKFPVETGRCKFLEKYATKDMLERNINSAYPLIHEKALELCCRFIVFKSKHGSNVERKFYEKMDLLSFIDRLLTKRAVMFMGKFDKYLLLNGKKGSKNWETIGTDKEAGDLKLQNCLSYDEIKLSVFLSVSSYTYFVNVGDRKNMAKFTEDRSQIQDEGIIVGMIGPRMKKDNVMEYQEIVFSAQQNTKDNGYGKSVSDSLHKLFSEFYEEDCLDYKECEELRMSLGDGDTRFTNLKANCFFDNHYYYKRLTISFDTLLIEANSRALTKNTTAYIHVVGLGLGVWKISPHQEKLYMRAFAERISILGEKLKGISDICFSYINVESCGRYKHGEIYKIEGHPLTGIRIHIYKRNPHTKLTGRDAGKLLVISYAWDGNSLPGNEYWSGKLGSSGDSAAASSTQIAEIHNPHINPAVCADNLKVVTEDGIVTFSKYQEMIRVATIKRKL